MTVNLKKSLSPVGKSRRKGKTVSANQKKKKEDRRKKIHCTSPTILQGEEGDHGGVIGLRGTNKSLRVGVSSAGAAESKK